MSERRGKNRKQKIIMFAGTKDHQANCRESLEQLDVKVLIPAKKQQALQFVKGAIAIVVQDVDVSLIKKLIRRQFTGHIICISKKEKSIFVGEKEFSPFREDQVIKRLIQIVRTKMRNPEQVPAFA
jgi:hypothetical protein